MVFGESLVVPGEFFPSTPNSDKYDTDLDRLRRIAAKYAPSKPSRDHQRQEYIPKALSNCEYVFVRHDAAQPPLSPPYRGPFRVQQRREEAFQLQLGNRVDWVSLDRNQPTSTLRTTTTLSTPATAAFPDHLTVSSPIPRSLIYTGEACNNPFCYY